MLNLIADDPWPATRGARPLHGDRARGSSRTGAPRHRLTVSCRPAPPAEGLDAKAEARPAVGAVRQVARDLVRPVIGMVLRWPVPGTTPVQAGAAPTARGLLSS